MPRKLEGFDKSNSLFLGMGTIRLCWKEDGTRSEYGIEDGSENIKY